MRVRVRGLVPWLSIVAACGGGGPGVARERGPCRADGTCDPGLQCLSRVCVEVVGERCEQVGRRAAALLAEEVRTRPLLAAALGTMPARIASLLTAACTDDGWSPAAGRCVLDARDHDRVEACLTDLPPGPRAALTRRQAELAAAGDRVERDLPPPADRWTAPPMVPPTGPTPPPPITPDPQPALTGTRLGPRCEAYVAILRRYSACPALPRQARDAIADTVVSVRRSFGQVPAASRHLLEDGCGQGTTAMSDALSQLGCP